ncbi:hypothetical protein QQS21_002868 [Conoideocrella luteorostrata]|uniref:NAD-dependent epimerase/dehydratase domain-containing protein n=1 Tax=Conoideocrella luteorostrata TaxID=1105319 RepID=A0AAJ0CUF3_9HYPO|nr:hypothetical protein QQS21_002868 [Conoideocrella luteorostrata]
MPRILVLGATGYLGTQITKALHQTGHHTVYGSTRSPSSARNLVRDEIIPIILNDPANEPQPFIDAVHTNRIDVVIDATSAKGDSSKIIETVAQVGKERAQSYERQGIGSGPKLGYLYISGFWVHGETATEASDLDPVGLPTSQADPIDLVKWRPEIERQALATRPWLDVMILRPALTYGRASTIWAALFKPIFSAVKEGKQVAQLPVTLSARTSLVHVDDVAAAVSSAVTKLPLLAGSGTYPVFNLSSSIENMRDILEAFAASTNARYGSTAALQLDFVGPGDNLLFAALGSSVQVSSSRANQYLNWEPRRIGLVRRMDIFAQAWEAGHG